MASSPISFALNQLLADVSQVAQAASSPAAMTAFVNKEAQALGVPQSPGTDLFPIQCQGTALRILVPGVPNLEIAFHDPLEQGRMTEKGIGEANAWLQQKKLDLTEKIAHYLSLNQLAVDGQLSDAPRAIKYAKDSIKFLQQITTYMNDTIKLVAALEANVALLNGLESRMMAQIQTNLTALNNLLNEVCNWGIPNLPSLAAQLGNVWHWNGFNFNLAAGFRFNPSLNAPNLNFSFSQCQLLVANLASVFGSTSNTLSDGTVTYSQAPTTAPLGGTLGTPTRYTDIAYIAVMRETTSAVYDPTQLTTVSTSSLPDPAAIISNYALPPATYASNIVSAVPALASVIVQASDPDFAGTPNPSRSTLLRALLVSFVNLSQVVASDYDPNLTAAWLIYMQLNRNGRGGTWIANFEQAYTTLLAPSMSYLSDTPIPWNNVLGSTGVTAAPAALPLIATLKGDTTNHLLWKLSYLEASLLGYGRTTAWDSGADDVFLAGVTGTDLDYVATSIDATQTASTTLGADTAAYPVTATYPQAFATNLTAVVSSATTEIAANPYQSARPQFRVTYNVFAVVEQVDKYTQFWRDVNANLMSLLTDDPYLQAFVATYEPLLASAIDPFNTSQSFAYLQADAASRSRTWTPGSVLPGIPKAIVLTNAASAPTSATNGWSNGDLDSAAFLARPDVQAQSIPVQMAMLRTSQSIASLNALQASLQASFAYAKANAQSAIAANNLQGWSVQTSVNFPVQPGSANPVAFDQTTINQTGFVRSETTVVIQTAGSYMVSGSLLWPDGSGTYTASLLQNGIQVASQVSSAGVNASQVSTQIECAVGDTLEITAAQSLTSTVELQPGSLFLGLLNPSAS